MLVIIVSVVVLIVGCNSPNGEVAFPAEETIVPLDGALNGNWARGLHYAQQIFVFCDDAWSLTWDTNLTNSERADLQLGDSVRIIRDSVHAHPVGNEVRWGPGNQHYDGIVVEGFVPDQLWARIALNGTFSVTNERIEFLLHDGTVWFVEDIQHTPNTINIGDVRFTRQ